MAKKAITPSLLVERRLVNSIWLKEGAPLSLSQNPSGSSVPQDVRGMRFNSLFAVKRE